MEFGHYLLKWEGFLRQSLQNSAFSVLKHCQPVIVWKDCILGRFQVLTAVSLESAVFWDVTHCMLIEVDTCSCKMWVDFYLMSQEMVFATVTPLIASAVTSTLASPWPYIIHISEVRNSKFLSSQMCLRTLHLYQHLHNPRLYRNRKRIIILVFWIPFQCSTFNSALAYL
jgi:hypothetical protein